MRRYERPEGANGEPKKEKREQGRRRGPEEEMAGNKRGVVDWTQAPDPTMRHNGAPVMVLHMKERPRMEGTRRPKPAEDGGGNRCT